MAELSFLQTARAWNNLKPASSVKITSASTLAKVTEQHWPPPPVLKLRELLYAPKLGSLVPPPVVLTPELTPYAEEGSTSTRKGGSASVYDQSVWTYYEPPLGPTTVYVGAEQRLSPRLRAAAQAMALRTSSPNEVLAQAATIAYCNAKGCASAQDTDAVATALADLTATGQIAYSFFASAPPQDGPLFQAVQTLLQKTPGVPMPLDTQLIRTCVTLFLDRAYSVAWALRDPNPVTAAQTRATLGWIAVSGEDDSPDRPVNCGSTKYLFPQSDVAVPCTVVGLGGALSTYPLRLRYTVALPQPSYTNVLPNPPIRQVPPVTTFSIPDDHEIILFIHGQDSNIEECEDLAGPLQSAGLAAGKKYAIIAFDQVSSGYSQMVDHLTLAPRYDNPNDMYTLLEFLDAMVVSFVDTIDQTLHVKPRIAAVIGGSLGANLALRIAERISPQWLKNIVAWDSASVWPGMRPTAPDTAAILSTTKTRMLETPENLPADQCPRRVRFFFEEFDQDLGSDPKQPEQWYRQDWNGTIDGVHASNNMQGAYIANDRAQRQEVYNSVVRRWHWRTGLEQLLFSHIGTDTPTGQQWFTLNHTRTLLMAGSVDDFNYAHIYPCTRDLAMGAVNVTPGDSCFLLDTGHSIHNERPELLAQKIVDFLQGGA